MKIGSKVICINAAGIDNRIPNKPEHMQTYTVRDLVSYVVSKPGEVGVLLKEIENPLVQDNASLNKHEPTFNIKRFIEADEQPAEIIEESILNEV